MIALDIVDGENKIATIMAVSEKLVSKAMRLAKRFTDEERAEAMRALDLVNTGTDDEQRRRLLGWIEGTYRETNFVEVEIKDDHDRENYRNAKLTAWFSSLKIDGEELPGEFPDDDEGWSTESETEKSRDRYVTTRRGNRKSLVRTPPGFKPIKANLKERRQRQKDSAKQVEQQKADSKLNEKNIPRTDDIEVRRRSQRLDDEDAARAEVQEIMGDSIPLMLPGGGIIYMPRATVETWKKVNAAYEGKGGRAASNTPAEALVAHGHDPARYSQRAHPDDAGPSFLHPRNAGEYRLEYARPVNALRQAEYDINGRKILSLDECGARGGENYSQGRSEGRQELPADDFERARAGQHFAGAGIRQAHHSGRTTFNGQGGSRNLAKLIDTWGVKFCGGMNENVEEFLSRVDECNNITGLSDAELLRAVPLLLGGTALSVYRVYGSEWFSWGDVVDELRARYGDEYYGEKIMDEIRKRTQGASETALDYITAMQLLYSKLPTRCSEPTQIVRIYNNMRKEYLPLMRQYTSKTSLSEFIRQAISIDKIFALAEKYVEPPLPEKSLVPEAAYSRQATGIKKVGIAPVTVPSWQDVQIIVSKELESVKRELLSEIRAGRFEIEHDVGRTDHINPDPVGYFAKDRKHDEKGKWEESSCPTHSGNDGKNQQGVDNRNRNNNRGYNKNNGGGNRNNNSSRQNNNDFANASSEDRRDTSKPQAQQQQNQQNWRKNPGDQTRNQTSSQDARRTQQDDNAQPNRPNQGNLERSA